MASPFLSSQIYEYFAIIELSLLEEKIHISLDELMGSKLLKNINFKHNGFMEALSITDFPIKDHKVILRISRHSWTEVCTGKSFCLLIKLDMAARDVRHSKEFGAFLKRNI